jgi:hypothetical protein
VLTREKVDGVSRGKLEFISQNGIVAPKILGRVNRLRNRLEHELALPLEQEVDDALEIATLFVSYAELVEIPSLTWSLAGEETIRYDYEEMVFQLFEKNPDDLPDSDVQPVLSVAYGDARFQEIYDFLTKTVPLMKAKLV